MSTAISIRSSLATRIDSLAATLTSEKAVSVGRSVRNIWWALRPVILFAVHVALLTLLLGFSRWAALDTVRGDITGAGPTLLAVFDAFDAVTRAAEAIGSSVVAANTALWIAWLGTALTIAFTALTIAASRSRSWSGSNLALARFPRRLVREVFAVAVACVILARFAGEASYSVWFWANAAEIGILMWVTVYAERRWVVSPKRFRRIENLPIGTAIMVGHGDGRALDPLAGSASTNVASKAAGARDVAR